MAKYTYDELTPIVAGAAGKPAGGGGGESQKVQDVEVWPAEGAQNQVGPQKPSQNQQQAQQSASKSQNQRTQQSTSQEKQLSHEKQGKGQVKRETLTDTEKVIDESDATARGVLKKIYEEAQRKARKMLGKVGSEAGNSLQVFKPLITAKIDWLKLLKQKVRFFVDRIGKKIKSGESYLMYPWKAQTQVGIIAKGSLRKPKYGYIYMIFAFDTSGSITQEEMQSIVTELNSVAKIFSSGKLSGKVFALEWDTVVHQFVEYTPSQKVKVMGGGGTEPACIFRFIDKKIIEEKSNAYVLKIDDKDAPLVVKKIPGTKYTTAPFLVIFTDGQFSHMSKQTLGKVYGISENNIMYILTTESGKENIYPKDNYILYDKPQF